MKYQFNYQTTAFDIWQLSMRGVYGSMVGVSNIIFTVAMFMLTVRFWGDVNSFIKMLLVMGIGLFTFIQPVLVYLRAKRQAATLPEEMEIGFDDEGVHINTEKQRSVLQWTEIKGVYKKTTSIVIMAKNKQGFILTNRVLGKRKDDFYDYVLSKSQREK